MKVAYNKIQRDWIWAEFAKVVNNLKLEEEIVQKWVEMGKHSTVRDKILKEVRDDERLRR